MHILLTSPGPPWVVTLHAYRFDEVEVLQIPFDGCLVDSISSAQIMESIPTAEGLYSPRAGLPQPAQPFPNTLGRAWPLMPFF